MPKCPNCDKEITMLLAIVTHDFRQVYFGNDSWGTEKRINTNISSYSCPECTAVLFDFAEDADNLLCPDGNKPMREFEFTVHAIGEGSSLEEAWEDAKEQFRAKEFNDMAPYKEL